MPRKIGYIRARYPETRNIIGRAAGENEYVQLSKWRNRRLLLFRGIEIICGRIVRHPILNWDRQAVYKPIIRPRVDVIHTFNTVCKTDVPWVCTFETAAPRTNQTVTRDWVYSAQTPDRFTKRAFELLAKDSCIALLALSEANRMIQISLMEAYDIPNRERIAEKVIVLPPPQPLLITKEELSAKFGSMDKVEVIFIGSNFFRKGGAQIIDCLSELRTSFNNFHLTVIGKLIYDDISAPTSEEIAEYTEKLNNLDWITYYERLPNSEVLELCKQAHVGLLPSMADTYGYSVLEMQSCGCAVITTDIRAMSEMNNDSCGYLAHVPKLSTSEARFDTPEDVQILKETIFRELKRIFTDILSHPESIEQKAYRAAAKINTDHSPEEYARRLSEIYDRALEKQ